MKPTLDPATLPAPPTLERRSFIWKAGAALSAGLASAAAVARPERATPPDPSSKEPLERLSAQVGLLEDTNAIRNLHHAFGERLNERLHTQLVELFADAADVHFDGAVFTGKDAGIRHLYVERFAQHGSASDGVVHTGLLDHTPQQHTIEIAPDRQSATARFHCLVRAEAPLAGDSALLEMARQQGGGVARWWESGVFENSYVKEGGQWKIRRLDYRPLGPAEGAPPVYLPHRATAGAREA